LLLHLVSDIITKFQGSICYSYVFMIFLRKYANRPV